MGTRAAASGGDAFLFAQKHGQFFGQFAGIKEAVEVGAKHTAVNTALGLAVRKGIKGRALHHGPAGVDLIPLSFAPAKALP